MFKIKLGLHYPGSAAVVDNIPVIQVNQNNVFCIKPTTKLTVWSSGYSVQP